MNLRELRFGVELETVRRSELCVAEAVQRVVGGSITELDSHRFQIADTDGRHWQVKPDGSLDGANSAEIASPPLCYPDIPLVQAVARAARTAGARTNRSCGIHVHVDASAFDGRALANLSKLVYNYEDHLYRALGVRRYRREDYCRPVEQDYIDLVQQHRPRTLDDLRDLWYPANGDDWVDTGSMYNDTRYHGLNLHAVWYHGTVEFRYYEGTLHAGIIKSYIHLALALAAYGTSAKSIRLGKRPSNGDADVLPVLRTLLMRLGLRGREFHNTRYHLLRRVGGRLQPLPARALRRVCTP